LLGIKGGLGEKMQSAVLGGGKKAGRRGDEAERREGKQATEILTNYERIYT